MAVLVQHDGESTTTHAGGTKWVIDDGGRLHVIGDDGNIASYNNVRWDNVMTVKSS